VLAISVLESSTTCEKVWTERSQAYCAGRAACQREDKVDGTRKRVDQFAEPDLLTIGNCASLGGQ